MTWRCLRTKVKRLVNVGDYISLEAHFTKLLNHRYATKTADDGACVAILLRAAEALQSMNTARTVDFVFSSQEEVGGYGAMAAAFSVDPDDAVTLDVCHADTPGAPVGETFRLDSMTAATCLISTPCCAENWMRSQRKTMSRCRHRSIRTIHPLTRTKSAQRARHPFGTSGTARQVYAHHGGDV